MYELYTEKYIKGDECPWLVFLHGFGGSIKMWNKQVDCFKDKYNILFIDLPGHGKSRQGIKGVGITKFTKVADIIVNTLKENSIERATFICVSLGSLVFAGILASHPDIIDGAVLCGAVSGINIFCQSILSIVNKLKGVIPYMIMMKLFAYILMPFRSHAKSRKFFIDSGKQLGREEFIAWFNLLVKDINILKNLKDIRKNILFVTGNEDFVFISGVRKKYQELKQWGLTKLTILNKCGHVCSLQKHKEFNSIAIRYLDTIYECN